MRSLLEDDYYLFDNVKNHTKPHFKRCVPCLMILMAVISIVFLCGTLIIAQNNIKGNWNVKLENEIAECTLELVESIPEGLNYSKGSPTFLSTFEAWETLLNISEKSLDIGSYYWTMLGSDVWNHTSSSSGEKIFQLISEAGKNGLDISIVQNVPDSRQPDIDTKILIESGAAKVRSLNMTRLIGNGILHTKLWVVDKMHFYLGSANMDWRALTQVKELGILGRNCPTLAMDLLKIYSVYWYLGTETSAVPNRWPSEYDTKYNMQHPIELNINKKFKMDGFFSSSPPPLSPTGRTNDLDAILKVIASAERFVHIAVMDYFPLLIYTPKRQYWPLIDDAVRRAAIEKKVSIKMLISIWRHSDPTEDLFLKSLSSLSSNINGVDIQIRRFRVPSSEDQSEIPFARVNHNKYMVTDNSAYIGTSNWSGDYFTDTAGVGLILKDIPNNSTETTKVKTIRDDLQSVFQRDWDSPYAVIF